MYCWWYCWWGDFGCESVNFGSGNSIGYVVEFGYRSYVFDGVDSIFYYNKFFDVEEGFRVFGGCEGNVGEWFNGNDCDGVFWFFF